MADVLTQTEIAMTGTRRAVRGDGPDFICIGAQKGGTQWLYDQLVFHPDLWMTPIKELHVFDRARRAFRRAKRLYVRVESDLDKVNAKRVAGAGRPLVDRDVRFLKSYVDLFQSKRVLKDPGRRIEAYARLFRDKDHRFTGDVTPGYSKLGSDEVVRIAGRFPEARILFIAREPIERLWSSFCMAARQGRPGVPELVSPESVIAFARQKPVALRSYPSVIVERWRSATRPGQFGLFFFDDLRRDAAGLRSQILGYIGADPALPSGDLDPAFNRKSKTAKLELTGDVRAALVEHFAEELVRCEQVLGGPAVEWRRKYGV